MAVSGVSNSRSIYGTRNVITGLASGMDTEGMIENAISAYKNKISSLTQQRTKTEWKQESYRSMINKMSSFLTKYTSYRSANNLMSTSFFDQAVKTVSKGANKDMVSATGRASSDVRIDRVKQLASSTSFTLSGSALDPNTSLFGGSSVSASASGVMDLDGMMKVGSLEGSLTLAYGGSNATSYLNISLSETQTFESAEQLAEEINKQLSEQSVSIGTKTYTGKELLDNVIKAEVKDGKITFTDPKGNGVYVSGATGTLKDQLLNGQEPSSKDGSKISSLTLKAGDEGALATKEMSTYKYLMSRGGSMEITLDGKTKAIQMPNEKELLDELRRMKKDGELTKSDGSPVSDSDFEWIEKNIKEGNQIKDAGYRQARDQAFVNVLQNKINDVFGEGKLKISDANVDSGDPRKGETVNSGIKFQFEATQKGSTFSVNSSKGEVLGFGESNRVTSYLNTGKTLKELMGEDAFKGLEKAYVRDSNGNKTSTLAKDANGDQLYSFKVNGKEIGQFNENSTLADVMNAMNSNSDSAVKVGYSKLTNNLTFSTKETGEGGKIQFDGLSAKLFGFTDAANAKDKDGKDLGKFTAGTDAVFQATINGEKIDMTRSSNSVDLDGMTVNLRGTFGYEEVKDADGKVTGYNEVATEGVTFETSSDADKIVDVVKQMVEDYNTMVKEIKDAYSTLPAQRSNGAYYEPLTSEDEEDMSESAIKNWTEKAKQGILFGDRDLASLYQRLTSAVSMTGENGAALRAAGVTVSYSNGLTQLEFNETKFREALNNDPDKVRDAFTASVDSGAKSNGLMQALKQPLDVFGKTEGGKGVLVEKAGSPLAPSTMYNNTIQKELNNIDSQIERWQEKMEDQIDHYTSQFSRLEQLIQQMNSQSSYFSQLMGG